MMEEIGQCGRHFHTQVDLVHDETCPVSNLYAYHAEASSISQLSFAAFAANETPGNYFSASEQIIYYSSEVGLFIVLLLLGLSYFTNFGKVLSRFSDPFWGLKLLFRIIRRFFSFLNLNYENEMNSVARRASQGQRKLRRLSALIPIPWVQKVNYPLQGLPNTTNICFGNSVIQSLGSLQALGEYLCSIQKQFSGKDPEKNIHDDNLIPISSALLALLNQINRPANHLITILPSSAKLNVLLDPHEELIDCQQQDAQEYLLCLISALEKELIEANKKELEPVTLAYPLKLQSLPEMPNFSYPFWHSIASRLICTQCQYVESIRLVQNSAVLLSIPQEVNYCYLEDCIDLYTVKEELKNVPCLLCSLRFAAKHLDNELHKNIVDQDLKLQMEHQLRKIEYAIRYKEFSDDIVHIAANIGTTKVKQTAFLTLPAIIVFGLNRLKFNPYSGFVEKDDTAVFAPLTLDLKSWSIDMENIVSENKESFSMSTQKRRDSISNSDEAIYELKALVSHSGSHQDGHYISYRKVGNSWYVISDMYIHPITQHEALGVGDGVVFFYEKVNSDYHNSFFDMKYALDDVAVAD